MVLIPAPSVEVIVGVKATRARLEASLAGDLGLTPMPTMPSAAFEASSILWVDLCNLCTGVERAEFNG